MSIENTKNPSDKHKINIYLSDIVLVDFKVNLGGSDYYSINAPVSLVIWLSGEMES